MPPKQFSGVRHPRSVSPTPRLGGAAPQQRAPHNNAAALRTQNSNVRGGANSNSSNTTARKPALPPVATKGSISRPGSSNRTSEKQQQQAPLPPCAAEVIDQMDAAVHYEQQLLSRAEQCIPELEAQLECAIEQRDAEGDRVKMLHAKQLEATAERGGEIARELEAAKAELEQFIDEENMVDEKITMTMHQINATREDGVKQLEQRSKHLAATLETKRRICLEEEDALAAARAEERQASDNTHGLGEEAAGYVRAEERAKKAAAEAHSRAIELEMTRRKLNSKYEELKGTIRVYCRVKGIQNVGDLDEVNKFLVFPDSNGGNGNGNTSPTLNGASAASDNGGGMMSSNPPPIERPTASCLTGNGGAPLPSANAGKRLQVMQSRDNATSTGKRESQVDFSFDRVFGVSSTQSQIFDEVYPFVDGAVDGYRTVIFSYGATGSGKTFTIEGTPQAPGLIPRSIDRVFERIRALHDDGWQYEVSCSFVEIYNETIRDLLQRDSAYQQSFLSGGGCAEKLEHKIVHEKRDGVHLDTRISNVREFVVDNPRRVHELLRIAHDNRTVAETKMNDRSSRSHCVFTMRVTGHNERLNNSRSTGILCLIDLAGSEKLKQSGALGDRQTEAIAINSSLSHLKTCISALSNAAQGKRAVAHWHKSKLTFMLQNYLQGEGAKMLMFVTVSNKEEHVKETVNSLRFATDVNETRIGVAKRQLTADS